MHPPHTIKRRQLYWLAHLVETYGDADALYLLWWQSSIGIGGINEAMKALAEQSGNA